MPRTRKIKNMTIKSVDLCRRGANPLADICLKKSIDEEEPHMNTLILEILAKSMDESNRSILANTSLSDEERVARLRKNADDYALAKAQAGAFDADDEPDESTPDDDATDTEAPDIETDSIIHDKPPFPPRKPAQTRKACGSAAPVKPAKKSLDPAVRKALDEVETLRKQLELTQLRAIAEKYEPLGKSVDELTAKLYDLKKSGAYDDYVALLDEMLVTQNASGVFKEFGSSGHGVNKSLDAALIDVRKAYPGLNQYQQILKAYELNPDLPEM